MKVHEDSPLWLKVTECAWTLRLGNHSHLGKLISMDEIEGKEVLWADRNKQIVNNILTKKAQN